jgi:hypothetical protein
MILFLLLMSAIMVCVGAAMLVIYFVLRIIQGALWVFIKILECFVKVPAPLPEEPGSLQQPREADYSTTLDLHPGEWKVIK